MRVWDIHPGYLDRQSLFNEYREIHSVALQLLNQTGNSQNPEIMHWSGHGWALTQRHRILVCEMSLRGYSDLSSINISSNRGIWPAIFIEEPYNQYEKLKDFADGTSRIPIPRNAQELWSHHKYSVLARDQKKYKVYGRRLSEQTIDVEHFAKELTLLLRIPPSEGGIRNAIQHMWGHVSNTRDENNDGNFDSWSLKKILLLTQEKAINLKEPYLIKSTALSELMAWLG